jgi:Leucine-rich repeat (LRR) protein
MIIYELIFLIHLVQAFDVSVEWLNYKNNTLLVLNYKNLQKLEGVGPLADSLLSLDLKNNQITSINQNEKLTKLVYLDLNNNRITSINGIQN